MHYYYKHLGTKNGECTESIPGLLCSRVLGFVHVNYTDEKKLPMDIPEKLQ